MLVDKGLASKALAIGGFADSVEASDPAGAIPRVLMH
jgi:hypothetical protein